MDKLLLFPFQEALARKLSRRAALAGLAGGGVAATLTLAGAGTTTAVRAQTPSVATPGAFGPVPAGTEILWDTWGTPHIYAENAPGLFYAFGWAQAHNHGNLILQLYAQARGRGAEVYGEEFLLWDQIIRTMGLHERGAVWYAEQSADFRANLDAFAAGINAYAEQHPDRLDPLAQSVLPVDATDVLSHAARIFFQFLGDEAGLDALAERGSNGWAIAPSHTADGHPLLLANPHNDWSGAGTYVEAQLSAPGVYDAYGATPVGIPVLGFAFNDYLGWTLTANTLDAGDLYELTLEGDGYRFDGEVLPFESRTETIKVRQADGTLREETLEVRRSVHGPVVELEGATIAVRMAAVDDWSSAAGALEQLWDMARATNLGEFEAALRRLQFPFFTVIYADREGHILSLFNGQVPVRPTGDEFDWSGPIPGDTSAALWTEIHPYDDLPKVVDPPGGWVQNANSPPWYTTFPLALDRDDFPPYMAPQHISWRERRSIRMLEENPGISLEQLVGLKYSTRMELADRVLDDLLAAARQSGDATASEAAGVLDAWDRQALPTSTGALLFASWVLSLESVDEELNDLFSTPWDPAQPLTTPSGLKDPDMAVQALTAAAEQVQSLFGRLDVPWGDVARMQWGTVDLPANGFEGNPFGVFRVLRFDFYDLLMPESSNQFAAESGDSYVAAIEFGEPVRARVLMTYGNASQPGSPHVGDQLVLSANGEMRTAWRSREEIEANLDAREELG